MRVLRVEEARVELERWYRKTRRQLEGRWKAAPKLNRLGEWAAGALGLATSEQLRQVRREIAQLKRRPQA